MKIQPVQNNNTNFQGLHIDKKARKYLENSSLLSNSNIKECADKFEVVIKGEKVKTNEKLRVDDLVGCAGFSALFGAIGSIVATIGAMVASLPFINARTGMPSTVPLIGSIFGFLGGAGFIIKDMLESLSKIDYSLQVGKNVKKSSFGKTELETPISKKYQISRESFDNFANLIQIAKQNDQRQFINDVRKYEKNGIYEPKELLKILNDDEIKQNYKNGECFNYKLENNSNDTMLTKFLDIVPTKENEKDYQEIIKFMRKTKNIDYKQVDSNGISVIEKIINSENSDLLDLVQETEFDYSKELDCAYERIDNTEFKNRVKNLKVNFPNIKEAVRLNSQQALQKLLPELKSPFCNVKAIVNDLSENVGFDNLSNFISFCEDNGIDTSDIIL